MFGSLLNYAVGYVKGQVFILLKIPRKRQNEVQRLCHHITVKEQEVGNEIEDLYII